jgi:hypothetical protein
MVHTIFIVAIGWLALDALIVAVLLLTGSHRQSRRASHADITANLRSADPFSRLPAPRPLRLRIERRARRRVPGQSLRLAASPRSRRA